MKRRTLLVTILWLTLAAVMAVPALAAFNYTVIDDFEDGDVVGWSWAPDLHNGILEAVDLSGEDVGRVTFASSCYGPAYHLPAAVSPDVIQWRMRADGDSGHPVGGPGLLVRGSTGTYRALAQVQYHKGFLQYWAGSYVNFMPASEGTWYTIGLQNIDWTAHTFDLYIDGSLRVSSLPFIEPVSNLAYVQAYGCPWVDGPLYLDDIVYGEFIPDTDGDGVLDVDDMCPATTLDDPPDKLKKNRFAADAEGDFVDVNGTWSGFTIEDTYGCDEDQIIEMMGLGGGHEKFGITQSVLLTFISMY